MKAFARMGKAERTIWRETVKIMICSRFGWLKIDLIFWLTCTAMEVEKSEKAVDLRKRQKERDSKTRVERGWDINPEKRGGSRNAKSEQEMIKQTGVCGESCKTPGTLLSVLTRSSTKLR